MESESETSVRCQEAVAVLLSLLPLLDRETAAAITAPLQLHLRSLGRRERGGEPSRKRPRYGQGEAGDNSTIGREGDVVGDLEGPTTPHRSAGLIREEEVQEEEEQEEEEQVEGEQEEAREEVEGQEEEVEEQQEEGSPEAAAGGEQQEGDRSRPRERVWGYGVDSRGRIVAATTSSQLPLHHLPGKTPQATLRYATGGSPGECVTMAAELLHCQEVGQGSRSCADQLPGLVSKLTDTSSVFQPPSPCPSPTSTNPADLEAWDCTTQMMHIRSLLQLANRLTLLSHYHVGGFLRQTTSRAGATTAQERHGVLVAIANAACSQERRQYRQHLTSCGCDACIRALHWVDGGAQGRAISPCRHTEVKARFDRDHLANMTPTFFRQCILLHAAMPSTHAQLTSSIDTPTLSHTHTRLLAVELHHAASQLQQQGLPLPRSLSHLGLWHCFQVASRPEEAIDLLDGDGGFLVAAHIPGLLGFVQERAPATTWREGMRGDLVQFRCHAHDALELEHVYHASNRAHHLGYQALCAARKAVATAAHITVSSAGEVDVHARRLVCDIIAVDGQGTSTSIAETLLRAGLSYPMPDAPATFLSAFAEAEATAVGVFSVFPPALATSPEVRPDRLRSAFSSSHRAVHFGHNGEDFMVTNRSAIRCASHVLLWESREQGAGQGAFLRSRSPHHREAPFVRQGTVVCGYGCHPITDQELDSLPPSELEYTLTVRRTLHFNSYHYDGENIGRYINQGGLREAIDLMVCLAQQEGPFRFSLVEEEAQRHCNARFSHNRHFGAVVLAAEDMELQQTPVELLVNYGIESYWLGFFARHAHDWGLHHPMVRAVLWCAGSQGSSWPPTLRQVVTGSLPQGMTIPPNITPP